MKKKEKVELGNLEILLDEHITRYEDKEERFQKKGTEFYDRPGTLRGSPMRR